MIVMAMVAMVMVAGTHHQATGLPCLKSVLFLFAQRCSVPPHPKKKTQLLPITALPLAKM